MPEKQWAVLQRPANILHAGGGIPIFRQAGGLAFFELAEAHLQPDLKWPRLTTIQSLAIMAVFYVVSIHLEYLTLQKEANEYRLSGQMLLGGCTMEWPSGWFWTWG
jgi:hypothetical protein